MKQVKILSAAGLLLVAGAAHADFTSTIALVSDYDYRGVSQTVESPAVQLSIDFAAANGWYIGTWGSNVDGGVFSYVNSTTGIFSHASTEVDLYSGFKLSAGDVGLDFGLTYYTYAGATDYNFAEIYAKASYKIVSAGLFYSNDFGGKATGSNSDEAFYLYGDVGIPAGPLTVGLHAGYSNGDGITEGVLLGAGNREDTIIDLSVGVSYTASGFTTGLKWIATDAGKAGSDDRIVLSITAALPFAK